MLRKSQLQRLKRYSTAKGLDSLATLIWRRIQLCNSRIHTTICILTMYPDSGLGSVLETQNLVEGINNDKV